MEASISQFLKIESTYILVTINLLQIYWESSFWNNICGADLADMQLISKYNEGIPYLLCSSYFFSKYAQIAPFKDKKGTTIANSFQKSLHKSNFKPNII